MADTSSINALTSDLVSGSINFTGLGSGSDFDEVIEALMKVESIQKTRMEIWRTSWEDKITSITSLSERLSAVEEAAGELDTLNEFMALLATSGDENVATASATSTAIQGAYSVTVGTDSQQVLRGAGVADAATAVTDGAGGNLVINVNGTDHTIALGANATLSDVAAAINTHFGVGGDVTASVEDDGTGSRPLRLQLLSNVAGTAGTMTIKQSPLLFSLDSGDVDLWQGWGGGSTPTIAAAGHFNGDSADTPGGQGYLEYSITLNGGAAATVGTDTFQLDWSVTTASGVETGSVTVDASYQPGDNIYIDRGVYIQLGDGTINVGDGFDLRAYANDVDDAEWATHDGTSDVSLSGNYMGTVNNTYNITVMDDGTLADADPSDSITLRWTDSWGNTGVVEVAYSNQAYELEQGVYLTFTAGDMVDGDSFSLDVFAPEVQHAQDSGVAQSTKVVHSGMADADYTAVTAVGGGDKTFTYVYAGEQIDVTVPEGTTLNQLASLINTHSSNPGVYARVINDGLGLPDSFRLLLTGEDSGAGNQISYISHDFEGGTFDGAGGDVGGGFTRTQWATNSMIQVDGFPADPMYLQRQTNTVSDVITGVSLDLHEAGTTTVTVSPDINTIGAKIEALVNAINYAQDFIRTETAYNAADDEENGIMIGNYGYQIIKSRLDSIVTKAIPGLSADTDTYTHLAQVGIESDPNDSGRYQLDATALIAALNNDLEGVAALFIRDTSKGSEGMAYRINEEMEVQTDSETGMMPLLKSNYEGIIESIDARIEREERRLALVRGRLEDRFTRLETLLSELNGTSSAIESAIKQLPSNSK